MKLQFDVTPYVKNTDSGAFYTEYEELCKKLKEIGFSIIEDKREESNSPSPTFSLDKYQIWKESIGWIVAESVENKLYNHIYFKHTERNALGRINYDGMENLGKAINYVLKMQSIDSSPKLYFSIKPHILQNPGIIKYYLNYGTLFEELKNIGFSIENYKKLGDSPTFALGNYRIWYCSQGYAVAQIINNRFCNHIYFYGGLTPDGHKSCRSFGIPDLERAINWVIEANKPI